LESKDLRCTIFLTAIVTLRGIAPAFAVQKLKLVATFSILGDFVKMSAATGSSSARSLVRTATLTSSRRAYCTTNTTAVVISAVEQSQNEAGTAGTRRTVKVDSVLGVDPNFANNNTVLEADFA
jgi:hypothetical protein